MTEDLILMPYERRHVGPRGQFIFRRHEELPEIAAKAIAKRKHPQWSQHHVEVRFG